ncbi:MAG: transcriptional repressor [Cellvibrionales bacterium]|jgi:Fur family transcriptional regulator, zinc uptake regulator|nr:transcriptional repressor [Cellvibrionales bacterium]
MVQSSTSKTLQNAEAMCLDAGVRLTMKRKRTLALLLEEESPVSAYELIDLYKASYGESLTAMSAYRMLNFLVEETLAHRLNSVNKYTACEHINCNHAHDLPQFLICDNCQSVSEAGIQKHTLDQLKADVLKSGFSMDNQQLELHGLCSNCQ